MHIALGTDVRKEMPASALTRVRRAAAKAGHAEQDLRAARAELQAAIVAAREAGESLSAIAGVVGVTRQRIKQIIGQ